MNINLDSVIQQLQRIAQKNHDEFRYNIELKLKSYAGIVYRLTVTENMDDHIFAEESGLSLDEVAIRIKNNLRKYCDKWMYDYVE
jgi:hypothetical protein